MNAQTANAYYSPLNNEIVFPAAILQPPFFDYRPTRPRTTARSASSSGTRSRTGSTFQVQVRPEWQLGRLVDRWRPRAIRG